MSKGQPIIVIKKGGDHGGHHGGAWKVAYADFVTAMMALFIVLWLMNTSEHVRKAVAGYFNDPSGKSSESGTDRAGSSDSLPLTRENINHIKEQIQKQISQSEDLKKLSDQIEMTVTPEGLRIEIMESKEGTFFESGSTSLSENGRELLEMLAKQLGSMPNKLSIEGHTDSQPYSNSGGYSNWELSVDRANAARKLMQETGLGEKQVSQVRGYADQRLRVPATPLDPSNRRVSLIVQYLGADAPPLAGEKAAGKGGADPEAAKGGEENKEAKPEKESHHE
jgi:chemotaxis protein MotB